MADAPHSKCGGKPCRFKSDCRYHFSQIFGSAFFVVVSGVLVSRRKIDFGIYYKNVNKMVFWPVKNSSFHRSFPRFFWYFGIRLLYELFVEF